MLLNLHRWGVEDRPTLVCLHGNPGDGLIFRRLAEERLASRMRVLAPDLRGFGHSSWDPPWKPAAQLADVLETVAAAGVERGVWLGFSLGGRLLVELVAQAPERVERVVLLDPGLEVTPQQALPV